MLVRDRLCDYAITYDGDWGKIAKAIAKNEPVVRHPKEKFICVYDREYPSSLRKLRFPPWVLFYEGDIQLLQKPSIAVIGSRNHSQYGERCTKKIVRALVNRYVIVSGLARGIDGISHKTCIESGGKTIGVIGSGLGTCYPKSNQYLYEQMKENHLIISEYPYATCVRKEHFPWRNRIIAALSKSIFVTEANCKSGTMLTVNEAINLDKDIYCVPYPIDENRPSGCNLLISQGAFMLYDYEQLAFL